METNQVNGLRVFLLKVLRMIGDGKKECCSAIESAISCGVASELSRKYPQYFGGGFNCDSIGYVDKYFEKWVGCADGFEDRKYLCEEQDGLHLLIALALNDIY